ncbi:MAG: hypothetical protein P1U89_02825 [Verrucomicrobiales bacterium]|nr:hypothetical protein [Verrucomicrobiales bacterium]
MKKLLFLTLVFSSLSCWFSFAQDIPDELLEDEHVREEFGINEFTTPSIRKIFDDLKKLRPLPYEELKRFIPTETSTDRSMVAITLGFLIADGFYAVEAEQFLDLEPVGLSLLNHAKAIGAGERIKSHTKALLDHQNLKDWNSLKNQLSQTQKDVEKEMVLIRDVDLAHLIALGGWLRAFEIGCAASLEPFDAEKAAVIAKPEIVEYFVSNLETMAPRMEKNKAIQNVITTLKEIQEIVTLPEQEILKESDVKTLQSKISPIVDQFYGVKVGG